LTKCYFVSGSSSQVDVSIEENDKHNPQSPDAILGGDLRRISELEEIFDSYCSSPSREEEKRMMDIFQFKQMCRELEISTVRFIISDCESIYRRAAQKYRHNDKISFEDFRDHIFKMIVHERKTVHDDLIEMILMKHHDKETHTLRSMASI
jgi:hypothetical protein